ncbi:UDP-N-acetylglucosamine 2-epimerase [Chitinophaga nivalis]|uniref:UDP-N-acetylglucosamine 2-epimerase n=1 Tax=Chitinophaga nivalis TaxID=2991709 RepID=A0ABT3IN17_9BACT|nr:UDP-N-acetylglucosamine 2-epimerase [Chitinophaga nivalis]MCW3464966.1 UDP-N-acetylglucosamine 2-epimerase [Chitinophaga nivalis]MCW3485342.1 UDP-N-acetylglucosamine 2-epimerase [Chitinophaga nivalis]
MKRPLLLPIIATKPCFIKMASLINAMQRSDLPFLLLNSNQHYDEILTTQIEEFGYKELIGVNLCSNGPDFGDRIIAMCQSVTEFLQVMSAYPGAPDIIPLVSGDTFSAGMLPQLFYFLTGVRSVHIEAGLRSYGPANKELWLEDDFLQQTAWDWTSHINDPFPEGMDSRLASVAAELLFAPVERNRHNLLREGYRAENITITGSLSSDAVEVMRKYAHKDDFLKRYPFLAQKKWLRVDLHRRENMQPDRLLPLLRGITRLSRQGMNVLLMKSNAMMAAIEHFELDEALASAVRAGVNVCDLWPSYLDVVSFMLSEHCLGLYTDSGGLQEEAHILGVPCLTMRYSTDRPETILDVHSNLLLPPVSEGFICNNLIRAFDTGVFRRSADNVNIYGSKVAERMVTCLEQYVPKCNAAKRLLTY